MTIEEKIDLYTVLTVEERREVEQYVSEHPQLASALEEAKRWDAFLRKAAVLAERPPSDEALALYVVMKRVDADKLPEHRREAYRRIEEAVRESAELQRRVDAFERRAEELDRASDARAQFQRLTAGFTAGFDERRDREDRHAAPPGPSRRVRFFRRAAAAVIGLATLYVVLLLASQLRRPLHERLAAFDPSELSIEGFRDVRSVEQAGEASASTSAYLTALDHLRGAQSSFVGLFPQFDEQRLDSAAVLLGRVIELEPEESFLANEARFLLAKIELARGDRAEARRLLQHVIEAQGRRRGEAAALLQQLGNESA